MRALLENSRNDLEKQTKARVESLESRLEDTTRSLGCVDDLGRRLAEAEASLSSLDELGTWCSDQVGRIRPSLAAEADKLSTLQGAVRDLIGNQQDVVNFLAS